MNQVFKEITFVANHVTPLKDGKYTLSINQKLSYEEENSQSHNFNKTLSFVVAGERFKLNPRQIHNIFPPANTQGNYQNCLPHIVFNRRTLPWERSLGKSNKNGSWLAILLFNSNNVPKLTAGKLSDLYPSTSDNPKGLLPHNYWSYGNLTSLKKEFLEYGEKNSDPCSYIDIPKDLFAAIAPSPKDLNWNAHGRTISKEKNKDHDYAVVVGNKLPSDGINNIAHLVSLEGLINQLPNDKGVITNSNNWEFIRLVSLKSWDFHTLPLKASFTHILNTLNYGLSSNKKEIGDSQLRLPKSYFPKIAPSAPKKPIDSGYTVLANKHPKADINMWYRGPLTPSTISPKKADNTWSNGVLPTSNSQGLVINVKSSPPKDVSLATAWQLGRLIALADKGFSTNQVDWKRDCRLQLNTLLNQSRTKDYSSRSQFAENMRSVLKSSSKIKKKLGKQLSINSSNDMLTIPESLIEWLGGLAVLNKVPFNYLVPDMKMLPPESIRFFNVNPRWLACLLDGAWSLGRQPSKYWAFDTAYKPWKQILDGSLVVNNRKTLWPKSGILINSQLISSYWPGIQFNCSPKATILREECLGPNVLLLLFDKKIQELTIKQPLEGIHFGFDITDSGNLSKVPRYLKIKGINYPQPPKGEKFKPGTLVPEDYTINNIPQRTPGVLQFDQLAKEIQKKLTIPKSEFSTAQFALELIESVSSATFKLP